MFDSDQGTALQHPPSDCTLYNDVFQAVLPQTKLGAQLEVNFLVTAIMQLIS